MKAVLRKWIAAGLTILVPAVLTMSGPTVLRAATNSETPPISDGQSLSAAIDSQIAAAWSAAGVVPAAPASDAEFLRRVYLDLVGAIPPVGIVREFLEDTSPNKRAAAGRPIARQPPLRPALFPSASLPPGSRGDEGQSNALSVQAAGSLAAACGSLRTWATTSWCRNWFLRRSRTCSCKTSTSGSTLPRPARPFAFS